MKRHAFKIIDSYVTSGEVPTYTSVEYMRALASGRQLGIFVRCTEVAGIGALTVDLEHSADGKNFRSKYATYGIDGAVAVPLVNQFNLTHDIGPPLTRPDAFTTAALEPSPRPSLAFARLAITLSGSSNAARVEITVSVRGSNDLVLAAAHPPPTRMPSSRALRQEVVREELRTLALQSEGMSPNARAAHIVQNLRPESRQHLADMSQQFAALPDHIRGGMLDAMKTMMGHAMAAAAVGKSGGSCCGDAPAPSSSSKGCGCG